jgi:hypothetical protein
MVGPDDLTGFFWAGLNGVVFNLEEGVDRSRTSDIVPSPRLAGVASHVISTIANAIPRESLVF